MTHDYKICPCKIQQLKKCERKMCNLPKKPCFLVGQVEKSFLDEENWAEQNLSGNTLKVQKYFGITHFPHGLMA